MLTATWSTHVVDDIKEAVKPFREWATTLAPYILMAAWVVLWATGGISTQSAQQAKELNQNVATLNSRLDQFSTRLDTMPSMRDFQAEQTHSATFESEMRGELGRINDRVNSAVTDLAEVKGRLNQIYPATQTPVRQAR